MSSDLHSTHNHQISEIIRIPKPFTQFQVHCVFQVHTIFTNAWHRIEAQ